MTSQSSAGSASPDKRERGGDEPHEDNPMVATHSEGMQLHLSDKSASGYQYVVAKPSGKFQAMIKNQFLGSFDTALEAAVCVATHIANLSLPPPNLHGAKRGAKRGAERHRRRLLRRLLNQLLLR